MRRRLNSRLGDLPNDWGSQMPGVAGSTPTGDSVGQYGGAVIQSQSPAGNAQLVGNAPQGITGNPLPGTTSAPPNTARGQLAAAFSTFGFTADGQVPTLAILPQRLQRRYLLIQATDASLPVWIGFGSAPLGSVHDMKILGGDGVYEPYVPPNNAIFLYGAAGATAVIIEGV